MGFKAYLIEKIWGLIRVHYQLYKNGVNYLKTLHTGWTSLNPILDEVYNMITSIWKLILQLICSRILSDLPRL